MKSLHEEYVSLLLRETRNEITRDERMAILDKLNKTHPEAVGLTKRQLERRISKAIYAGMEILDELNASPSGRWQ